MQKMDERRGEPRYPYDAPCAIAGCPARTLNLSRTGLRLGGLWATVDPETRLRLQVPVPGHNPERTALVSLDARLVWHSRQGVAGLAFDHVSWVSRHRLDSFLKYYLLRAASADVRRFIDERGRG